MIGWLRGEVISLSSSGHLILSVRDVGYSVSVPERTAATLREGEIVDLYVHTHVRDDAILLYGFESQLDRETFNLLLATPGVGPSTALGALSTMTASDLATAVANEDVTKLASIPGIGKKTAARLVLELGGKLTSFTEISSSTPTRDVLDDVSVALRQLGYSAMEIRDALKGLELPEDDEAALRIALRQLGRR